MSGSFGQGAIELVNFRQLVGRRVSRYSLGELRVPSGKTLRKRACHLIERIRPLHDRIRHHWSRQQWRWEFINWSISLASYLATLSVLAAFDGSPVPQWRFGMTLNTLVSVLATVGQLTLVHPVTASIGQLKWTYFRQSRPLKEFVLMDEASRGPWGSLVLLVQRRGGSLSLIASALILCIPLTGPLAQHAISFRSVIVTDRTASVPIAESHPFVFLLPGLLPGGKLAASRAIFEALFATSLEPFHVDVECPSSDCTWSQYSSLAVCSHCADITAHMSQQQDETLTNDNWVLPNGVSASDLELLKIKTGNLQLDNTHSSPNKRTKSLAFAEWNSSLILDMFAIQPKERDSWSMQPPTPVSAATECILTYCINTYTASSTNGMFSESITGTYVNMTYPEWPRDLSWHPNPNGPVYNIGALTKDCVSGLLSQVFNGSVELKIQDADDIWPGGPSWVVPTPSLGAIYEAALDGARKGGNGLSSLPRHSLEDLVENVARSLTRFIRMDPTTTLSASGISHHEELLLHVQWGWTVVQLGSLLISIALLAVVVADTRREWIRAWKTSSLATMLYGLKDVSLRRLVSTHRMEEVEDMIQSIRVKLIFDESSWEMVTTEARG